MFGQLQAAHFRAYFRFLFWLLGLALFTARGLGTEVVPFEPLVYCLPPVLLNLFVLGPRTETVMHQRHKLMKELGTTDTKNPDPAVRKLSKQFGMFHGLSNLSNLVAMIVIVRHTWLVAMGIL